MKRLQRMTAVCRTARAQTWSKAKFFPHALYMNRIKSITGSKLIWATSNLRRNLHSDRFNVAENASLELINFDQSFTLFVSSLFVFVALDLLRIYCKYLPSPSTTILRAGVALERDSTIVNIIK